MDDESPQKVPSRFPAGQCALRDPLAGGPLLQVRQSGHYGDDDTPGAQTSNPGRAAGTKEYDGAGEHYPDNDGRTARAGREDEHHVHDREWQTYAAATQPKPDSLDCR